MWHDEAVTIGLARRSLADLWQTLGNIDAVHGLYYLLMHGLFGIFGTDLLLLRLPSVLATAAAAAGVALIGLRLVGLRAGLLAGSIFAVLPDIQEYAQEGRSYAGVCALVVWATYLLVHAVDRHQEKGQVGRNQLWAGYGTLMLAACLLHEFAALALVGHAMAVPRTARRPWGRAAAGVVAGLAPLALLGVWQSGQVAWIDDVNTSEYMRFLGMVTLGLLCAVAVPGKGSRGPHQDRETLTLQTIALPLMILPTALLMLLSLVKPLYVERYVLYGLTGFALLLGAAFDAALRRGRAAGTAAVVCVALVCGVWILPDAIALRTSQSRSDDVTALAVALREQGAPGDGVLYLSAKRRAWTLAYPPSISQLSDLAQERSPADSHSLYGTELQASRIRDRMLASPRILVVREPVGEMVELTKADIVKEETLAAHFNECRTVKINGARITVYTRSGHCT